MKNRRVRIVWVETLHNDIPFAGYILSLPFQNATSKPQESSTHSNQNFNLLSPQHPLFSFVLNMTALVKITCWVDHSNLSRKSFSISEEANFSRLEDPVGWGVCSSDDLMLPHQLQSNSLSRYWYIHHFFEGRYEMKVTDASPTGKLVGRKRYVSTEKGPALLCFIQILTIVGKCMIILPCYSSIEILTNAYRITGMGLRRFRGTSKACSRTGSKRWSSLSVLVLWKPHPLDVWVVRFWWRKFQWSSLRNCRILAIIHGYCIAAF